MTERDGPVRSTDWAEVRRRLDAMTRAVEGTATRTPEGRRALLRERAAVLARPREDPVEGDSIEVLICGRGAERWAVETRFVVEVMPLGGFTPLPGAEADVLGVTAWRGEPLLLRELVGGASVQDERENDWVVSLGTGRAAFGIVVDEMPHLDVLRVSSIHPPPAELVRGRAWLRGITDDAILVVDGRELIRSRTEGSPS